MYLEVALCVRGGEHMVIVPNQAQFVSPRLPGIGLQELMIASIWQEADFKLEKTRIVIPDHIFGSNIYIKTPISSKKSLADSCSARLGVNDGISSLTVWRIL